MKLKNNPEDYSKLASFILRVGLAVPFLYAAVAATLQPEAWIGFMPQFLQNIFPAYLLLGAHSSLNIILGLWLLSGWKTTYAAALSALTLLTITLTNLGALDIIFRDIGLFLAAVSLALLHSKK
ncbi:MAG TPA: hypothetical protein VJA18_07130 [Candidatus Nanoarchaeia archaeon]|nr:hypothetical protein [Candidatus Nanoarchaeia archaeon]